jgi:IclR family pca regulon transcriptional regulator
MGPVSKAPINKARGGEASVSLALEVAELQGDPEFMLTLGRGLAVLGAFGTAKRKLTVSEISRMTSIPPQAVRRCLYTFAKLGFMGQSGLTWAPRPRLLSLGYVFFTVSPFSIFGVPVIEELHQQFGLAFSIGVFDDDEVTYLARTGGGMPVGVNVARLDSNVPDRRPAYCTAPGRTLLASLTAEQLETYLQRTELKPLTERTVTSPQILRVVIEQARDAGYALVDQEAAIGLRSIALPILDESGITIGALGAAAIAAQWSLTDLEQQVLPEMRRAARELGRAW